MASPGEFPIWSEIVCRKCAETTAGQFTIGNTPRMAMKRRALNAGWQLRVFDREHLDWVCRECIKRERVKP